MWARAAIYEMISDPVKFGMAVILGSADLEQILGLAYHVLVMSRGRQRRIFAKSEATSVKSMELATSKVFDPGLQMLASAASAIGAP